MVTLCSRASSTAATTAPDGAIYSITAEGEIHWINGSNGSTRQVITNGNLFKWARGIVRYCTNWRKGHSVLILAVLLRSASMHVFLEISFY